jgi:diaminopimelate decarboxylase
MHHFSQPGNELYCEEVPVERIAAEVGTPFYLYSASTLKRHFLAFTTAFAGIDHIVCYSVKANSSLAVIRTLALQGAGADVVSGGELYRALRAGVPAGKIVFSGVGKREDELRHALDAGILMFNVESEEELRVLNRVARDMGRKAPVALRVNPDVDPKTHPYISTGLKKNKFGIPAQQAPALYHAAARMENIAVVGVDCHIGSQLTTSEPFGEAVRKLVGLVRLLEEQGIPIRYLDVGGGLGITYASETPPLPADYARTVLEAAQGTGKTLIFEPGRVLVGNAGILVTRVLYTKESGNKRFVVVDVAMNDLMRPCLYDAYHRVSPVMKTDREEAVVDVVGPICESSDFIARDRMLPRVASGELLAVFTAGAYGFSMSSQYNSRPRVAEVMVEGDRFEVVRARERYEDLVRGERAFHA